MFLKYVDKWLILFVIYQCITWSQTNFTDVTTEVFSNIFGYEGVTAAYGDVNNDKFTDVFIISGK